MNRFDEGTHRFNTSTCLIKLSNDEKGKGHGGDGELSRSRDDDQTRHSGDSNQAVVNNFKKHC